MRQTATFPLDDPALWKKRLLHWAADFERAFYLDSNGYGHGLHSGDGLMPEGRECLVATGAVTELEANAGDAFARLVRFQQEKKDWLFGFFGYDLKNEIERLDSQHPDRIGLPDLAFVQPETVVMLDGANMEIQTLGLRPETVFEQIGNTPCEYRPNGGQRVTLTPALPKDEYLRTVETIREHIVEGDLYEMNLCQEFFAEGVSIDPVAVFQRLNAIGKAPFSTFMRRGDQYLLSASPERFLKKEGRRLISQPIKGTRRRSATDDEAQRLDLSNSEKDRSENVMIVDLVRNDLARNCVPGSVRVDELFGIYTFETVHQMISTVSGTLRSDAGGLDALRAAFPPGSMTGAPKVMAMELIERYERSRRGLYSGAVGYMDPAGDFDFNVVIRSILYNAAARAVSVQVGGAIVYDSVPEQEYEECLVKAEAMMRALA